MRAIELEYDGFDNKISSFFTITRCRILKNHEIKSLNANKPDKSTFGSINLPIFVLTYFILTANGYVWRPKAHQTIANVQ